MSNTNWKGRRDWRDWAGRALLALAAIGAAVAFVSALGDVTGATDPTRVLVTWRFLGLGFFAGVFALLAIRPRGHAGLFELAILNKAALAVLGLAYGPGVTGAPSLVIFDGGLAVVLVAAYVLTRGWTAWRTGREGRPRDRVPAA